MSISDERFSFRISVEKEADSSLPETLTVPQPLKDDFDSDGFVVVKNVLDSATVTAMNEALEQVLRGSYNRGRKPDKAPKLIKGELRKDHHGDDGANTNSNTTRKKNKGQVGPLGFSGNLQNVKVLQVINVHKCNHVFWAVATSAKLGKLVAELAGWKHGARLGQDQVWAKPPGASPLVFHRDSPYFMFDPPDVVTVWIALDDMDKEIGPLEYVRGSHKWGDGRVGSASQFFQSNGGRSLLESAAKRQGVDNMEVVSMAGLKAGGISIHHGRTWHGSGKNESKTRPRRGLGLHFVPAQVRFTPEAAKSKLWRPYVENVKKDTSTVEPPLEDFPVVWAPGFGKEGVK